MTAFYNEIDPTAAAWLRELISKGHIAPGIVDERSIEDIIPEELAQYTQCHFFAGIGVWSYALRSAGWADDVPCWTGSCPCQPFSAAGAGGGFDDERHLWPSFAWLIEQCKPAIVFGEQVASKAVEPWVDLVHADLEAMGYAFGAVPFPSAGVGAPHIRDRLFWVAHTDNEGLEGWGQSERERGAKRVAGSGVLAGRLAHTNSGSSGEGGPDLRGRLDGSDAQPWAGPCGISMPDRLGHTDSERVRRVAGTFSAEEVAAGRKVRSEPNRSESSGSTCGPGPANGFWSAADWVGCRDDKWRPVEPGTSPLVTRLAAGLVRGGDISQQVNEGTEEARVIRLRGYGNAINAEAAEKFISVFMEVQDGR